MSDNPEKAQHYRKLVLDYETLDQQIDTLLEENGGHTEKMSATDMERYRELAQRRDELFNQIKDIEAGWLNDEGK